VGEGSHVHQEGVVLGQETGEGALVQGLLGLAPHQVRVKAGAPSQGDGWLEVDTCLPSPSTVEIFYSSLMNWFIYYSPNMVTAWFFKM